MHSQPYNPHYDPLIDKTPGCGVDYAPSYWVASAGAPPENDGEITSDIQVDVAIIGGGFTGLATAMFLAEEYGIQAVVLEANHPGWGCTSRNGGQGHLAWGRMSRSQWVAKWGADIAKAMHKHSLEAFDVFAHMTRTMDCEPCGDGNLLIATSHASLSRLQRESDLCNQLLEYPTKMLDRQEIHSAYIQDQEAYGGLLEPIGIAVHPLKLAFGYMKAARARGAKVHVATPVLAIEEQGHALLLRTPKAKVTASHVVVATAGYTHPGLHQQLAYKNMPIMANSAVTRILTAEERAACGMDSKLLLTDARRLRHYYRLLPDNRLQIGTRSAISGADAANPKHLQLVKQAIATKFPAIAGIQIEHFWSGWMDISHDMMPRIVQPKDTLNLYYAQGYSGNGVSFSAYSAQQLAALVVGKKPPNNLPIFTSPLPSHPLRPLRRFGQRLLFGYFSLMDKIEK